MSIPTPWSLSRRRAAASNCSCRPAEEREEPVSRRIDFPPSVAFQLLSYRLMMHGQELVPPLTTQFDRPRGRTDDVDEEDGRHDAVNTGSGRTPVMNSCAASRTSSARPANKKSSSPGSSMNVAPGIWLARWRPCSTRMWRSPVRPMRRVGACIAGKILVTSLSMKAQRDGDAIGGCREAFRSTPDAGSHRFALHHARRQGRGSSLQYPKPLECSRRRRVNVIAGHPPRGVFTPKESGVGVDQDQTCDALRMGGGEEHRCQSRPSAHERKAAISESAALMPAPMSSIRRLQGGDEFGVHPGGLPKPHGSKMMTRLKEARRFRPETMAGSSHMRSMGKYPTIGTTRSSGPLPKTW